MRFKLCFSTLFAILFSGCENPEFILQKTLFNCEKATSCECKVMSANPHSGNALCRLDTKMSFGPGFSYAIPNEFQKKELRIIIKGWIRSNRVFSTASVIVSTTEGADVLSWQGVPLRNYVKDLNQWNYFHDSLIVAAGFNNRNYNTISVYAYLGEGEGEVLDFDDFEITVKYKDKF
jgi:hypothetical protein